MVTAALQLQLFLASYVIAIVIVVPRALPRCGWLYSRPRWGLTSWLAAVLTVMSTTLLLAVSVTLPVEQFDPDLGHLLHACITAVGQGPTSVTVASAVVLTTVLAAVGLYLVAFAKRARSVALRRRKQRELLDLIALERDPTGAYVLDHEIPLAYCVPGRRGRIVFTSAARDLLSPAQLSAVIAHEQAHLRGRHNLLLLAADSGVKAFPRSYFFRTAGQQVSWLVEMLADDRAVGSAGRRPLITALVRLGQRTGPEGSLGATEHLVAERISRLVDPGVDAGPRWWVLLAGAISLVVIPWIALGIPLLSALLGLCPW